jgi:hypothetical protein
MDRFQERYLKHQNKKKNLMELMARRRSYRFLEKGIDGKFYEELEGIIGLCPSSCDRKGIDIQWFDHRAYLELLSGVLRGGVGWAHRADKIGLLWARREAYKSPNDTPNMYLDAGVILQQAHLFCEANDVGMCFVNPNVNSDEVLKLVTGQDDVLCGALVIGKKVV